MHFSCIINVVLVHFDVTPDSLKLEWNADSENGEMLKLKNCNIYLSHKHCTVLYNPNLQCFALIGLTHHKQGFPILGCWCFFPIWFYLIYFYYDYRLVFKLTCHLSVTYCLHLFCVWLACMSRFCFFEALWHIWINLRLVSNVFFLLAIPF